MVTHIVNGSPLKPFLQLQIGLWFITLQSVFIPQEFVQGLAHLWFIQAWV